MLVRHDAAVRISTLVPDGNLSEIAVVRGSANSLASGGPSQLLVAFCFKLRLNHHAITEREDKQ
jgi:hypothetical protein